MPVCHGRHGEGFLGLLEEQVPGDAHNFDAPGSDASPLELCMLDSSGPLSGPHKTAPPPPPPPLAWRNAFGRQWNSASSGKEPSSRCCRLGIVYNALVGSREQILHGVYGFSKPLEPLAASLEA